MSAPHPRTVRPGAGLRILRAAVFAAVCVVLSGAGHAIASCAAVPLWTLGAGFLGVLVVAAPLAGRERSLPGIAALLAVGQTVLHTLFGLGQHGTAATDAAQHDAALVEQAARLVCGTTTAALSPVQAQRILVEARLYPGGAGSGAHAVHHPADAMSTAADSSAALLPALPMLLGHLLAAVVAGWLLRRGDLALLRIAELSAHSVAEGALVRSLRAAFALARALRAGLPGAPDAGPRLRRACARAVTEPRTTALQHTVIRRGPPAAVLVLAA
ncbi:hypothetical protein I2W78_19575 [Streptomyces spinoverrucosus]|uniref:hypothetical protein n=1 Tax=Streptomyces spinoverrucosus TaxID=284043 RepID=UPI0018C36245|nr:hypothetical protein [Streptomyces spinoverrucosus]MBG0853987.1 hypothetical protein [Streptomyces spinoverrucosus]